MRCPNKDLEGSFWWLAKLHLHLDNQSYFSVGISQQLKTKNTFVQWTKDASKIIIWSGRKEILSWRKALTHCIPALKEEVACSRCGFLRLQYWRPTQALLSRENWGYKNQMRNWSELCRVSRTQTLDYWVRANTVVVGWVNHTCSCNVSFTRCWRSGCDSGFTSISDLISHSAAFTCITHKVWEHLLHSQLLSNKEAAPFSSSELFEAIVVTVTYCWHCEFS